MSMRQRSTPRTGLAVWLAFTGGLTLSPVARADLGTALGASIGQSLPQYRAFQHADHPTLIDTTHDVIRVPASHVLGLMEVTLGGPHAGAIRALSGRGIGLEAIRGAENTFVIVGAGGPGSPAAPAAAATPGASVSATFIFKSTTACPEPATCVPYTPVVRDILLVPAVTIDTIGDTPIVRTSRVPPLTLAPEPATSTLKVFTPAEVADLPIVPGARVLLPYGFASRDGGRSPGTLNVAFHLSRAVLPTEDLSMVFAVIDTTAR